MAKSVWGCIGKVIGTYGKVWLAFYHFTWGAKYYMICIAALCWGFGPWGTKLPLSAILYDPLLKTFSQFVCSCFTGQVFSKALTRRCSRVMFVLWWMELLCWLVRWRRSCGIWHMSYCWWLIVRFHHGALSNGLLSWSLVDVVCCLWWPCRSMLFCCVIFCTLVVGFVAILFDVIGFSSRNGCVDIEHSWRISW